MVTRSWGNLDNNLGGCRHNLAPDHQQALELVEQIRRRQQARGYQQVD